ncbi:hypothetical protein CON18_30680 [Bacillus cereus]|nr:SIR2 family protein [Bacillus cereus]PDZ36490.1 hypothetical protein CON18_30680 [Bacillus cereus]PGS07959.1 hypothetical protein COC51_27045 [Bacillus cereus]
MIKENKYNSNLVRKLQKVLKQEDTILFVGSGISSWSGLPSWYKLISELANYLEREGYSNADAVRKKINDDLLLAASIGLKSLNKMYFKEFLKGVCGSSVANPHDIHKKIVSLGPTCYITTNYDQLLEDTLRENRKGIHWDVVTNRQLAELASLNQARYKDYVFKVHGDVNDIESVVLSREHYQKLYGERNSALNTLEILLTTKPVVFLGFGLRDPDFLQVRDKMKNIYGDNGIEHYAIMSDVSEEEISYWQTEYGIRILSYQTTRNVDGSSDHSELLEVLDMLNVGNENNLRQQIVSNDAGEGGLTDSHVLSLLRFIEGQKLQMQADDVEVYPMLFSGNEYGLFDINDLIKDSDNAIVLGEPGGGKTYCLKHFAIKQFNEFKELALQDLKKAKEVFLPIYVDLKGYSGNIFEMIESLLPVDISMNLLKKNFNMIFLFDSFNEMPKEVFEDKLYEKDFLDFKEQFKKSKLIIASRTDEGLKKFNFLQFLLKEIDYKYIKNYLDKNLIYSNKGFNREIIQLLQKPLYFKLLRTGKININNTSTPHSIFESFFDYLNQEFKKKLNIEINLSQILCSVGFYAIEKGSEKISIDIIKGIIYSELEKVNINNINENSILNKLIETGILITSAGLNLSFFHQSITEYLAAKKLGSLYQNSPDILKGILKNTRWDQAVFLTIGFLEEESMDSFFKEIFEIDICFAINACKYMEFNQGEIACKILNYLIEYDNESNYDLSSQISYSLETLPVKIEHEFILHKLISKGDSLGVSAVKLLDRVKGEKAKDELLSVFLMRADDFNLGLGLGRILQKYLDINEVKKVVNYIGEFEDIDMVEGLIQGSQNILIQYDMEDIQNIFSSIDNLNEAQLDLYFGVLRDKESDEALKILVDFIEKGNREAIFSLYLMIRKAKFEYNKTLLFRDEFIENVLGTLTGFKGNWALSLLKELANHSEIRNYLRYKHYFLTGVKKLGVLYCLLDEEVELFWEQYKKVVEEGASGELDLTILSNLENVDWSDKESFFQEIITALPISQLIVFFRSFKSYRPNKTINLSIDSILLILKKIHDSEVNLQIIRGYYLYSSVGQFLVSNVDLIVEKELIDLFNKSECPYRDFLSEYVLNKLSSVTTDLLSNDAIDYLLSKLQTTRIDYFNNILGSIATEDFIKGRLLPLLDSENELLQSNLQETLYLAGKNHKKRFISC